MKRIIRVFLINIGAIYFASQIAGGMQFKNYTEGVVITGIALGLASFTIKPVVNLLLLPINLATLGLFRFFSYVITLYIVDYALEDFKIMSFVFPGLKSDYLDLPALNYTGIVAYISFSVLIYVFISVINWIRK